MRAVGISAFVRCKNEEEYIVASLLSVYRIFDEVLVILNNSTDRTRELVEDLITDHPKIRLLDYPHQCAPIGVGYHERVLAAPESSLAMFYNWCLDQTSFSHVCKWDGDMIATPLLEEVRSRFRNSEIVLFDGHDVLGEKTTDLEPRIFKYDPARARYVDWDLYEVLEHEYSRIVRLEQPSYLHMKLAKREWLHKTWTSPNLLATRSPPHSGRPEVNAIAALRAIAGRLRNVMRRNRSSPGGTGR